MLMLIRNEKESDTPKAGGVPRGHHSGGKGYVSLNSYRTKKTVVGNRGKVICLLAHSVRNLFPALELCQELV